MPRLQTFGWKEISTVNHTQGLYTVLNIVSGSAFHSLLVAGPLKKSLFLRIPLADKMSSNFGCAQLSAVLMQL